MSLSPAAQKYLSEQKRLKEWCTDEIAVRKYFQDQKMGIYTELIDVQLLYSGYKLTIEGYCNNDFLLSFISRKEITSNKLPAHEMFGDHPIFYFGNHATAPFHFGITPAGAICTFNSKNFQIIYRSVEIIIEQYTQLNKLYRQGFISSPYYNITNLYDVRSYFAVRYEKMGQCRDSYNFWYEGREIIVEIGHWLDSTGSFIRIHAANEIKIENLVKNLKQQGLITS
ncbi:hypothetical protein ACTHGU_02280 [Chitinophagaceae bacterium MMS25-I14]